MGIVGLDELAYMIEIPLAPVEGDEFAGYHLVFGKSVPVAFERDDDGSVIGLVVGKGDLTRSASRLHRHGDEGEHDDDGT